jgi:putative tryptophan/tyrosine transport system substrate-binding protein
VLSFSYSSVRAPPLEAPTAIEIARRKFVAAVGGTALAWPLAARAQRPATPVVGFLRARPTEADTGMLAAFRKGLSETGFVEGKTVSAIR